VGRKEGYQGRTPRKEGRKEGYSGWKHIKEGTIWRKGG
jgi:hypothetical protein